MMHQNSPHGRSRSLISIVSSILALALSISECAVSGPLPVDSNIIQSALASPIRTEDDRENDESRKPDKFIQFIGLNSGETVAEINAGPGYYARIYPNIVGNDGHVFVTNAKFVLGLFDGLQDRLTDSLNSVSNVTLSVQEDNDLSLPRLLDVAILNNIYHDLHWQELDLARWNSSIYRAVRPGGYYIVADHIAEAGSGDRDSSKLHRIDPTLVKKEILDAGFELIEESDIFRNPNDDHTLMIVDPGIRGQTDRFLFKFRKPNQT